MTKSATEPLLVYNLFPRYYPTIDDWQASLSPVAGMGFTAVFVNPFHLTGFSGSLYAVKDYYRLNPLFLPPGADPADMRPIRDFVRACARNGLDAIMDCVINHTAFDADLVKQHPAWYRRGEDGTIQHPYAIDPANADNVTVWGDLAEIDNENSADREALWRYWSDYISFYQDIGFTGFRCDAAYKVPAALWSRLIGEAKGRKSRCFFLAETLGCRLEEIDKLASSGFDYLFNSSKWWNYDAPWCLEQHETNRKIAPSISFPESHDTGRLAAEFPGTIEVQKSRYVLAAIFSRGLLMPMGYEFGAHKRIDVVRGTTGDWEEKRWDLTAWIRHMNDGKKSLPVLSEEGRWRALNDYENPAIFLEKRSIGKAPGIIAVINKERERGLTVHTADFPSPARRCRAWIRPFIDNNEVSGGIPPELRLEPAEIVLLL